MVEKSKLRNIVGAAIGLVLLALSVIAWTTAPAWAAQAKGNTQCPLPQKAGAVKPSKASPGIPQGQRPPIDLVRPARTEIATFAMG